MPEADYHRHDISDKVWKLLKPHLPGQRGQWGGIAKDNRKFINAVFFILRTGSTWRDLPPDFSSAKIYALAEEVELGKKFSTFFGFKTLAGDCYSLCEIDREFSRRCLSPLHRHLGRLSCVDTL